jgi:hypothetical protein
VKTEVVNILPAMALPAVESLAAAITKAVDTPSLASPKPLSPVTPVRPITRVPVLLKPVVKPAAPRRAPLNAATMPDRHFEILAEFDLGNAALIPMTEASLQTVAATLCIRHRLSLELQAWPARIESTGLQNARVLAVQEWFSKQGISMKVYAALKDPQAADTPGVMCRILLDGDRALRDYFIIRDNPQEDDDVGFGSDVIRDAKMLEEDFRTCKH